jgi:putative phosphonate catabolism associated alcohol dehydrogenase
VLGHEAVGHVVAKGAGRTDLSIGQRVTWSLADSCGHCAACTDFDLPQKCDALFKYGHAPIGDGSGLNGCYASHIVLRAGTAVFPVPARLPDAAVVPANCSLATMVNVLEAIPPGARSVLVQGAGLLGLHACALLRHRGVAEVFCRDADSVRQAQALKFGAITGEPSWVDAVIEVAGDPSVVAQGIELLRPGGTYALVGMVHPQSALNLTGETIIKKCLRVVGVHNYAPRHLRDGLRFLKDTEESFDFAALVSPPLSLDELPAAVELAKSRTWVRTSVRR